jgi:hypothetical protein
VLETFTVETFAARLGERFAISTDGGAVDVELVEATPHTTLSGRPLDARGGRQPFSLVFLGPADPVLAQGIYRFEHAKLEVFEIFVVPIERDGSGVRYQAVFS